MNTNLRAMIDDALDGAYAQEQSYGYADYSDVPSLDNASEDAVKIASALNHVASNLQFIGTTEEKLAELELFSEMLKEAAEEKATAEAAEEVGKGLGESWDALKTKSVPDVWKNMSGTSKAIAGGGAALLGLGALYGGYKALGGGSEKRSALDEARSRAFAKIAQRYDIPVDVLLEKIAATPQLQQVFGRDAGGKRIRTPAYFGDVAKPADLAEGADEAAQKAYAENLKKYEGAQKGRQYAIQQYGALEESAPEKVQAAYKKLTEGGTLSRTEQNILYSYRSQNPLNAEALVHTVEHNGRTYTVPLKYQNQTPEQIAQGVKDGNIPKLTAQQRSAEIRQGVQDSRAAQASKKTGPASRRFGVFPPTKEQLKEHSGEALRNVRERKRVTTVMQDPQLSARIRRQSKETRELAREGMENILTGKPVKPEQAAALEGTFGENYKAVIEERGRRAADTVAHQPKVRKSNPNSATGAQKATTEAGEKELGFLARNRRTLLAGAGLGAAGLAGYGLYRAFGGGGQSKAASYMSKVAEDRINPARIRAGASDPFSGFDIRSHGGGGSQFNPVALRAQQVRSRINSDMQTHVNNVGGGYNLDHYLNRFNK